MQFKKGILTVVVGVLVSACASTDGTRYAVVSHTSDTPSCRISESWCVGRYGYMQIPSGNFAKDELLLVYSGENAQSATDLMQTYQLKPKNRVYLGALQKDLITADTNGQNPLYLKHAINTQQGGIQAQTNNYFYIGADSTVAATPSSLNSAGYPFSLTGVEDAYPFTRGKGVKIGMVDTPLDMFHKSLKGNKITQIDLVQAQEPKARLHGTEIAGTLISNDPRVGIAPEASLYAVGAFGKKTDGTGTAADIAQAIDLCIKANVDILNLSFAGDKDDLVDAVIKRAVDKGIIVVASAGNNGPDAKPAYPAALDGVIAVTAIDNKQNIFAKANRGSYIDLAAPGVGILTTSPESSYKLATGTSIATAHVSGLIALLLSMKRDAFKPSVLTQTAIDLGQSGRDNDYGYGLVNLSQALKALK